MADYTHDEYAQPSTAKSLATFTLAHSHTETESGLTAAFNQNRTTQEDDDFSTSVAFSEFTIAKSHSETESGLTTSFNTEFVATIVFDVEISPEIAADFADFDPRGIPIIISDRADSTPWIIYDRADATPVVFHSRGILQKVHDETEEGLTSSFNRNATEHYKRPLSSKTLAEITMDHTHDETESGCTASFSTVVA